MKKIALILLVICASCKKNDDPKPNPTPDPGPVVNHYEFNLSVKPAVYTQTAAPYNVIDSRDSSYFTVKVNNLTIIEDSQAKSTNNYVYKDSVKTGDDISYSVRMITYTKHAKECTLRVNKAWLMNGSSETVLANTNTVVVPVSYIDSIGTASYTWQFSAP